MRPEFRSSSLAEIAADFERLEWAWQLHLRLERDTEGDRHRSVLAKLVNEMRDVQRDLQRTLEMSYGIHFSDGSTEPCVPQIAKMGVAIDVATQQSREIPHHVELERSKIAVGPFVEYCIANIQPLPCVIGVCPKDTIQCYGDDTADALRALLLHMKNLSSGSKFILDVFLQEGRLTFQATAACPETEADQKWTDVDLPWSIQKLAKRMGGDIASRNDDKHFVFSFTVPVE